MKDVNFGSPLDFYPCLPRVEFYEIGQCFARRHLFGDVTLTFSV